MLPIDPVTKWPLFPALPRVKGKPSWAPYQTKAATTEDVLSWFAQYSPDMGGTGLSIGLVTGYEFAGSSCLYVVDVDRPDVPPTLAACNTTTVHTGRPGGAWHFYFTGPPGFPKQDITIDGTSCEFKGTGAYVVAPVSVHVSGTPYTFTEGLSAIQPLPEVLMEQLKAQFLSDVPHGGPDYRGRACLEQGWNRPLLEGERDNGLFALYQGLITVRHLEAYARAWTERKNAMLAVPLTEQELKRLLRYGPVSKRPGRTYGAGCPWVKRNLPWVICDGCHYLNEGVRRVIDGYKAERALQDVNGAAFKVYFAVLRAKGDTGVPALSVRKAAEATGLSISTVQAAFKELHDKGYL
jgi:hypothetical protein